jgi:uncharacterized protein YjbJ (UPF0337 family)
MDESVQTTEKSYHLMLGILFLVVGAICVLLNFTFLPVAGIIAGTLSIVVGITFVSHHNKIKPQMRTQPGKQTAEKDIGFGEDETDMDANSYAVQWGPIEASWDAFKPRAKEKWDRLSDDDLNAIGGNRDMLKNKLTELYGLSENEADAELDEFYLPENAT